MLKKYYIKIDEKLALKGHGYVLTLSNRFGTPSRYRIRKPIIVKRRSRIKSFYNCKKNCEKCKMTQNPIFGSMQKSYQSF